MPPEYEISAAELLERVLAALKKGDVAAALTDMDELIKLDRSPSNCAQLGFCLASVRGEYKAAAALCHEAIKRDPKNPDHYYQQGRVLLLAGRKKDAIWVMRMGLRQGTHKEMAALLLKLGTRNQPAIPFLRRENPINKHLGLLMKKLRMR